MALTNNIERKIMLRGYEISLPSAGTDVFYSGAFVNITAAGSLAVASDTASEIFGGVVTDYVSAVLGTLVRIRRSDIVEVPLDTTVLTDMGVDVFATADDTIARTATNTKRMGIIVGYDEANDVVLVDTAYAENA